MNILRTNFYGDPNLGLYGFATDKYCLLGFRSKLTKRINKALKTPVHSCNVLNTYLLGIFLAGNSSGVILPNVLEDEEINELKDITNTLILNSRYTALGNLILMNDRGIILSPLLRKERGRISKFFGVPCEVMTIGKSSIVGALALATNKGCLADTRIKDSEMEVLKKVLKVDVDIGTVNFGSPFVKAGLIGNSKGLVVSTMTSGYELGKITEALKMF